MKPTSIRLPAVLGLLVACCLLVPATAGAATYLVDSAGDAGVGDCSSELIVDCSLADAINEANAAAGSDSIDFLPPLAIELDDPLPAVTGPVAIEAFGLDVSVTGSAGYASTYCAATDYAFDLTDSGATPSSVRGLPVHNVCDRAIKSNLPPPSIAVGPRRFDNTVAIHGQAVPGAAVYVYGADGATTGAHEGDDDLYELSAPAGAYSYTPGSEPLAGDKFTALQVTAAGGSNFAARVTTPSDLASPALVRAVAVSNAAVRLDFNEPINPASVTAGAFSLSVASVPRAISSAGVFGNSVFLESSVPWQTGEAGSVALTGTTRVTDGGGNEVLGQPVLDVFSGPGESTLPQITSMRLAPNRFCKKATRRCRRSKSTVLIALNKPARVIFEVRRGGKRARTMVSFVRRLDAGRSRVKLTAVVSGKRLPASILSLRATAQDVARSASVPAEAVFRIVTDKSKL